MGVVAVEVVLEQWKLAQVRMYIVCVCVCMYVCAHVCMGERERERERERMGECVCVRRRIHTCTYVFMCS